MSTSNTASFRLVSAPFTPMHATGEIALEKIGPMAQLLKRQGVDGVFVCGTTGEGMSLTLDERMRLAEAWRAATDGLELIVHVGHTCPTDAQTLATHARQIGVNGIASIGPCFFEAGNASTLSSFCAQIATAAPEVPFYYYHMPSIARVSKVQASDALIHMSEEIPNFAGIKFTHEDLDDYRLCLELAGERWEVFFGRDELLLDALCAGATCAVGSTYNFATSLYRDIIQAHAEGDLELATQLQNLATSAINVIASYGGMPAFKAMMTSVGFDCGSLRLPLASLAQPQVDSMMARLEEMGYLRAIDRHSTISPAPRVAQT